MSTEFLNLYLGDHHLGIITKVKNNDRRLVKFQWSEGAQARGVRLTESFALISGVSPNTNLVPTFFGGYLPEGNQRQAMAQQRRIPEDDLFAFLREYGGSIAGALSFRKESSEANYEELSGSSLRRLLKDSVGKHNQGTRDDSRSMITGFQPKLLVTRFDGGPWLLPHGGAHSTHILKPPRPNNPERIIDEFYYHQLSKQMGLTSFNAELLTTGPMKYLAIERFDRIVDSKNVRLIHQEDAAQAMGLDWVSDQTKFQDVYDPNNKRHASAFRTVPEIHVPTNA